MPTHSSTLPWVLFANSGIQFIDGLMTVPSQSLTSAFIRTRAQGPICEVQANEMGEYYFCADDSHAREWVRPEYLFSLEESANQLKNSWIPLPFLNSQHDELTPTNWVRGFISPHSNEKKIWRISFAIDTSVCESPSSTQPHQFDTEQGQRYSLCQNAKLIQQFMMLDWVSDWLKEVCNNNRLAGSAIQSSHPNFIWQAHYLNLLKWLALDYPHNAIELRIADASSKFIASEVIIDLGNSNTCGVIYEPDTNTNNSIATCSEITLRDLSAPHYERTALFSSEVNFSPNPFGDLGCSAASGRADAFQWGSPVRIGAEAERLNRASGQLQQLQGVTSPRRYLWDDAPSMHTWYNSSLDQYAGQAVFDQLFSLQLNDAGELLSQLPAEQRVPLFKPQFRRSSLLMLMLTELFSQLFSQINSIQYRKKLVSPLSPRYVRRIIFTLPVNFTQLEQTRFTAIASQALDLLRLAHPQQIHYHFAKPDITVPWDEACCGQIFWLWQQVKQHSASALLEKYSCQQHKQMLRVALIDIGGGTTDLAITDYHLNSSAQGQCQTLTPQIRLRQGFTTAGDSLLQDIINEYLLPQLTDYLQVNGFDQAPTGLRYLFGTQGSREGDTPWRQHVIRHLFLPVVSDLLARYRLNEQEYFCRPIQLLGRGHLELLNRQFLEKLRDLDNNCPEIDFSALYFTANFTEFSKFLTSDRCRLASLLNTISDTVTMEASDILLLSGQVASLPGLHQLLVEKCQHQLRAITLLAETTTQESLPFCQQGKLVNGKFATALGGLLYSLIEQQRASEQVILAGDITSVTPQRWYGKLDRQGRIEQVLFNSPRPGTHHTWVTINGPTSVGYRCSANQDIFASPLFSLQPDRSEIANLALGINILLEWKFDQHGEVESLPALLEVRDHQGGILSIELITLSVNTLSHRGVMGEAYWRDDGRVAGFNV